MRVSQQKLVSVAHSHAECEANPLMNVVSSSCSRLILFISASCVIPSCKLGNVGGRKKIISRLSVSLKFCNVGYVAVRDVN